METQTKTKVSTKEKLIIPSHIGFILDGNRRWAKRKGLPTLVGHKVGLYDALIPLVDSCIGHGVKHVTTFCFSTENWNRSKEEVGYLMKLFEAIISDKLEEFHQKGVKVNVIGRLNDFPEKLQKLAQKAIERTKDNKVITLNVALSYGGRAEIVDATKKIIADGLKPEEITEEKFSEYIYEAGQPSPDIIVRTSGELRLSGFLLWQSAYSELYFTDVMWPDFNEEELDKVIAEYTRRERRFGK